jgi:threonine/homoserine/homoserine lactone efflux protein
VLFVVAAVSDPVRKPLETMFRVMMLAGAGVLAAFCWGMWESHKASGQQTAPTIEPQVRKRRRTKLSHRRHPDGTRDTCLETDEEHWDV